MVMYKIRAANYLRRTISEPYSGRRLSAIHSQIPDSKFQEPLLQASGGGVDGLGFTWTTDLMGIKFLFSSWLYVTLIFVPLGLMAGPLGWGDITSFWFNFMALVPLAALLGNTTEELALHTGDLIGGLLNATFGNAVEMILTVQSLRMGLLSVVQGTLLGSILSNLLLVLGMSFFAGGMFHHVQTFNRQGATCSTSLLMLACLAFIIPTVVADDRSSSETVLALSRYTAILVGFTYFLYLFFQLFTHLTLFKEIEHDESLASIGDVEAEDSPTMSWPTCLFLLLAVTLLISVQSEYLVASIEGVVTHTRLTKSFIGVILLPIVGNAAEHATAVTVAIKNKPDLTMGVAVGSSTQIAMFMVPFAVLVGWLLDQPMTLAFNNIAVVALAFSILITISVVQDGESNWLEGAMLMVAYFIIAGVYWFDESDI